MTNANLCARCGKRLVSSIYTCKLGHTFDAPCAQALSHECHLDRHLLELPR